MDAREVERIADLARIRLEPGEAEDLARDMQRLVEYVESLPDLEAPTADEAPASFQEDVHRDDRTAAPESGSDPLQQAPDAEGAYFRVPGLLRGRAR